MFAGGGSLGSEMTGSGWQAMGKSRIANTGWTKIYASRCNGIGHRPGQGREGGEGRIVDDSTVFFFFF